jgi:ABC-2 type transport system permease protein
VSTETAYDKASLGPPIAGPSALGGGFRRFIHLARTLAVTDFKLRFFGSLLGYFWQLARPLMLFGVLYVVFTQFLRLGNDVAHYPIVLLGNIVAFTFFAEGTGGAVQSVVAREQLVRKIQFPRMAIPVSVVITAAFNFALNTVVVLIFALANGVTPRWSWLQLPVLIAILALLIVGIAMLLSALYVRFRDIQPIWDVSVQALFYATPILYVIGSIDVSHTVKHAMMLNPLAAILTQLRHAVIDPSAPTAAAAAGGAWRLLIPLAIVAIVVVVGYRVFDRSAPRIAEHL